MRNNTDIDDRFGLADIDETLHFYAISDTKTRREMHQNVLAINEAVVGLGTIAILIFLLIAWIV